MVAADDRLQHVADQAAAVAVELEPGHRQADQRVDCPGVQAPMEECIAHRSPRRVHALRGQAFRWLGEVGNRLGGAPEHQADAHACGEQHRHPAGARELRFGIFTADAQVAETTEGQVHQEGQRQEHDQKIEPTDTADDIGEYRLDDGIERAGREASQQHQDEHQCDGNAKHHEGASPIKGLRGASRACSEGPAACSASRAGAASAAKEASVAGMRRTCTLLNAMSRLC
ncbi:hypothetical protein G6F31_014765 [Rhizopus arrhizus]|nr:hypothetical protein G6F31_014765 [Rhizopus arrhizus]